jgi:hypothetical protein
MIQEMKLTRDTSKLSLNQLDINKKMLQEIERKEGLMMDKLAIEVSSIKKRSSTR